MEISSYKMLVLLSSQENSYNYYNFNYSADFSTTKILTAYLSILQLLEINFTIKIQFSRGNCVLFSFIKLCYL